MNDEIAFATKFFGPAPIKQRLCHLRDGGLNLPIEITGRYHQNEMFLLWKEGFKIIALHSPHCGFLKAFPPDGPISLADIKDRYGRILEQAAASGTPRLVEHLGPAACERHREITFLSEKISELEEFARKFSVAISIEIAPGDAIYDAQEFKQFFSGAGSKLFFTLDVCHVLCEGRRIEDYLVNIGGRVDYVHLMDVDFSKSEVPKQVCLGDWPPVGASDSLCGPVSMIYNTGFRGPWVIESECYYFSRTAVSFGRVLEGLGITCGFFQTVQDFEDDILKRSVKWLGNYLKSKK